ncbi:MAG: serine/threonine protein kinase [Sandaracinaceae bacterium]|nr:serine/threonine protein kinase [Sandaracinaceae bacterium]
MRLAERYELGERVGSGGMGVVHRARDLATGETVAVKVLHHAGPDSRRRFAREAQALAQLSHEGVVRYVDSGADAEGRPFLVMEWLEGETLEERLARGPLGWPEVAGLARRLADALSALHARRIVHRDVKPTNVFLVGGEIDRAKLLDLGVAHVAMTSLALTRTGSIVGTPDYMSPEQARADRGIGPSADVFSLGCVLYHCLAGEPPFAGTRVVAVLAKILFSEPAPLAERVPEAPPALRELVERMLAKEPAERPEDGRALCAALRALPLEPSAPRPPSAPASLRPRIGDEESQVVSVVLSSALGGQPAAASSGVASREELATAVDARPQVVALLEGTLGATVHALAHGGLVATVAGTGSPVDRVASACRVALRMHDAMPDASIVIATGRGVLTERAPVGRVIEQAAARLDRVRPGVIGIDEATASLLDARFTLAGDEGALELAGERPRSDGVRRFLGHETQMVGARSGAAHAGGPRGAVRGGRGPARGARGGAARPRQVAAALRAGTARPRAVAVALRLDRLGRPAARRLALRAARGGRAPRARPRRGQHALALSRAHSSPRGPRVRRRAAGRDRRVPRRDAGGALRRRGRRGLACRAGRSRAHAAPHPRGLRGVAVGGGGRAARDDRARGCARVRRGEPRADRRRARRPRRPAALRARARPPRGP